MRMTELATESNGKYINSIIRASRILNLYRTLGTTSLGISEIDRYLHMGKTTVFRVVKTLEAIGWLVQEENGSRYRIGPMLILLSSVPMQSAVASDTIQQEMKRLRTLFNEDVALSALLEDDIAVCAERIRSNNVLKIASNVGRSIDLSRGASGKTVLAFLEPERQEAIIMREQPDITPEQKQAIYDSLHAIRDEGYGITNSEKDEGVIAVAVPIRGRDHHVLYSISIIGEANRMQKKGLRRMVGELMRTADYLENVIKAF